METCLEQWIFHASLSPKLTNHIDLNDVLLDDNLSKYMGIPNEIISADHIHLSQNISPLEIDPILALYSKFACGY